MIDEGRLEEILVDYKRDFVSTRWPAEKFKWEAIQHFQDNWDIDAVDFAGMLKRSLAKTNELLSSRNFFPYGMITEFAERSPTEVREMFAALFDENTDVLGRVEAFKAASDVLLKTYRPDAQSHYQNESPISIYLWLRFPDTYSIYKFGEIKRIAEELSSDYQLVKGRYGQNLRNGFAIIDEIKMVVQRDPEFRNLLDSQITPACYSDPELKTLAFDVGFYISRIVAGSASQAAFGDPEAESGLAASVEGTQAVWFPAKEQYEPGLTVEDWVSLLKNNDVFTRNSLEIMARMKHIGGMATCMQLAETYGENSNFYNNGSQATARRVAQTTGCELLPRDDGGNRLWTVLYTGRDATNREAGSYVWRLRDELFEALDLVDLSGVELYAPARTDMRSERPYSKADFLVDVFMTENRYNQLVGVLRNKKNIILQGAPGVGKTFAAKRLAWSMMGERDDSRVEFIQFHQNYSYEDFMMGYKPTAEGFELKDGVFIVFARRQANGRPKIISSSSTKSTAATCQKSSANYLC